MDFQAVTTFAKEVLLESGECHPTVFVEVEGDASPYILPFITFPFRTTEERERGLFAAARHFARKVRKQIKGKKIIHLAFACEGWGAQVQKTDEWVRPSRHPARKEVLFITMLDIATMKQEMSVFEMLRAGESIDLVAMMEKPDEVQSSLLPAFLTGIQTVEQDEGMARAKLRRVCEEYGVQR